MMCEKCGVNPAAVTLTRVVNGKKSIVRLCADCARETSVYKDMDLGFSSLFSSFFNDSERSAEQGGECPACHTSRAEFIRTGKPGCPECYTAFESSMRPLLKKIHSTTTHVGKVPASGSAPAENKIDLLRAELKKAVEVEEYEKAARLRDEIREMEGLA